ncbi:MAG: hypothetical protein K2X65_00465 [Burkholderiaceae bacterium]|nr:hypothetical protein [Burkholderiaceae bacterium]
MTKTHHTPGPWTVLRADWDEAGNARYTLDGITTIGINDARLIAAAPTLLEVLQELEESSSYWSEYDVPLGIVERIKDAIALATGTTA